MCRYKKNIRLGEGRTREARIAKASIDVDAEQEHALTPKIIEAKKHTRDRRAERAFKKMPDKAQKRIRAEQKKKLARQRLLESMRLIEAHAIQSA